MPRGNDRRDRGPERECAVNGRWGGIPCSHIDGWVKKDHPNRITSTDGGEYAAEFPGWETLPAALGPKKHEEAAGHKPQGWVTRQVPAGDSVQIENVGHVTLLHQLAMSNVWQ